MTQKDGASDRSDPYDLNRFISAQEGVYDRALVELRDGAFKALVSLIYTAGQQSSQRKCLNIFFSAISAVSAVSYTFYECITIPPLRFSRPSFPSRCNR